MANHASDHGLRCKRGVITRIKNDSYRNLVILAPRNSTVVIVLLNVMSDISTRVPRIKTASPRKPTSQRIPLRAGNRAVPLDTPDSIPVIESLSTQTTFENFLQTLSVLLQRSRTISRALRRPNTNLCYVFSRCSTFTRENAPIIEQWIGDHADAFSCRLFERYSPFEDTVERQLSFFESLKFPRQR